MTADPAQGEGARHRAAVLGHPVAHSLSPVLHGAAYEALGLHDWHYGRHDVDEPELAGFVAAMDQRWRGLSLTMPLKQAALQLVDVVEPLAQVTGAVNTLLLQPGGLTVGANTDVHGLVQAIRECSPTQRSRERSGPHGGGGVIIGAGATAASAIAALGELHITRPAVLVRSIGRTGTVRRAAAAMGVEPRYVPLDSDRARELMLEASVVISTVPHGGSAALAPWLRDAQLDPAQVLLDVVYEGWPTELPIAWRSAGGSIAPGYLMLLHQAAQQVHLMTGRPAPIEAMRTALLQAIEGG